MSVGIKKGHWIGAKDISMYLGPTDVSRYQKVKTYLQTQYIFTFFLVKTSSLVKVVYFRNIFLVSSILPKNEQKIQRHYSCKYLTSNCFVFWENWRHQKDISKLTDLY